jgi:SAM-dependent methyltransferase
MPGSREQAEGYDPYSEDFGDPAVLDRGYDFVTAQDVLEHVDDPAAFIASMKRYVAPGGCVVIGTPNADAIDLHHRLDQVGPLHQPYHRHIARRASCSGLSLTGAGRWSSSARTGTWIRVSPS